MLSPRDPFHINRYTQTKRDGKIFHANEKEKTGVAILISDKIHFNTKAITTD